MGAGGGSKIFLSQNILSKYAILCWDEFIIILGCLWAVGHGVYMLGGASEAVTPCFWLSAWPLLWCLRLLTASPTSLLNIPVFFACFKLLLASSSVYFLVMCVCVHQPCECRRPQRPVSPRSCSYSRDSTCS